MNPAMAAQYRQQYQQRGPQPGQVRRPQGPPQMTPEQMRAQRQREQLVQDQQRRAEEGRDKIKAKTPTDKTMPEGVDKLIVGDGVQQYKRLREVERKLDSVMMRKYLDMKDSIEGKAGFTSYQPSRKKLKIWISNTVENQPWQGNGMEESAFDFNMGVEATYKVKIQGQVIEDEEDDGNSEDETETPDQAADGTKSASIDAPAGGEKEGGDKKKGPSTAPGQLPTRSLEKTKLSHFFKGITIDFDRDKNLQPEGITQVEWKKQHATAGGLHPAADFDSLEFERKSDENMNCTVNFYWDEPPDRERYLLDKPLSELLDTEVDDRASIIMGIWEYIKALGLQHDENKRQIYCDERMKAVFERDVIYFPQIWSMLQQHLHPLPPVSVPYTIRVDPEYHSLPSAKRYTVYVLTIPTASSPAPRMNIPVLQNLSKRDDHLAEIIQAIGSSKRKHSFFSQMSLDPVSFTKRWMASQKRDLDIIMGEDGRFEDSSNLAGEWARGGRDGVWGRNEVREAVGVMVQKPDKTGRAY